MRNDKSDEADRSAGGSDKCGQRSREQQQPVADTDCADADVFGVALAEQQGVEWLDEEQRGGEECDGYCGERRQALGRDAVEVAQTLDDV